MTVADAQVLEGRLSDLLDDEDFHVVDERMSRFNLFEAMGSVRAELRHSNFLGFIFSPNRSHGLGSEPLMRVLRAILERVEPSKRPIMTLELLVGDLDDAIVHRERDNMDLLIEIRSLRLVVLIENKVDAKAGAGQLSRYKGLIDGRFPHHRRLLVFLTPSGSEPDHPDYLPFSYIELARVLDELASADRGAGPSESRLIIRHYVEMLRRHIVQDDRLRELGVRLYERHREAFDFILECRPEPHGLLDVARECIEGADDLRVDSKATNSIRFLPESWNEQLKYCRCDPAKWTHTGRGLLFEAKTFASAQGRVNVSLVLGPCGSEDRSRVYNAAMSRPALFRGLVKPMGAQWATIYSRDLLTAVAARDLSFDARAAHVSQAWADFQGRDLPGLTEAILAIDAEFAGVTNASLEFGRPSPG